MARSDDDTWDLATSVGATATGVAVGRALASRAPDPLIDDPFAEPLVRAVGVDFFTRIASGELDPDEADGGAGFGMARMTGMMAVRTRLIDDYFADAGAAGVRQVVILASGLDARAYRLPWASRTTVFEIDQPSVVEWKTRTLREMGAEPSAWLRTVAVDLRHDWPAALRAAGFDPAAATAWSAEGLLAFLPSDAQDRLLDNITALSAPGSRLIAENMSGRDGAATAMQDRMSETVDRWRAHGFDIEMTDLWYLGDRHDVADYLDARGWTTGQTTMADLFAKYGQTLAGSADETADFGSFTYVTATRD
jgi:methyltransferase (TIGR00027 family)